MKNLDLSICKHSSNPTSVFSVPSSACAICKKEHRQRYKKSRK